MEGKTRKYDKENLIAPEKVGQLDFSMNAVIEGSTDLGCRPLQDREWWRLHSMDWPGGD